MPVEPEDQGDSSRPKEDESNRDETETKDDDEDESAEDSDAEEDDEEEDDEEDDEPKLKYARLTSHLGAVYRNGDATSTFLVAGDKMVGPRGERGWGHKLTRPHSLLEHIMEIL